MDPSALLRASGVHDVESTVRLQSGFGNTLLWRVRRHTAPTDLVLRVFPGGSRRLAEREAMAHRIAISGGVPVPAVINTAHVGDDAALLMTWSAGVTAAERLTSVDSAEAFRIGLGCGQELAKLHLTPIPADAEAALGRADDWVAWAGDRAGAVREVLPEKETAGPDRLLHLDFHPENILVNDAGAVVAVIDWANTRVGPPEADLARSRSIHWLIKFHPMATDTLLQNVFRYEAGVLEGHRAVYGPALNNEFFFPWALAAQMANLEPKIGDPGVWVERRALDEMAEAYHSALAAARSAQ